MQKKYKKGLIFIWKNILFPLIVLLTLIFLIVYLASFITGYGYDSIVFALILILSFIIGVSHVILFFARRSYQGDQTFQVKKKKRRLERYRNIVNYLTPFILLGMLYHFWQREWVLATVIVIVLLFDRMNELIRANK